MVPSVLYTLEGNIEFLAYDPAVAVSALRELSSTRNSVTARSNDAAEFSFPQTTFWCLNCAFLCPRNIFVDEFNQKDFDEGFRRPGTPPQVNCIYSIQRNLFVEMHQLVRNIRVYRPPFTVASSRSSYCTLSKHIAFLALLLLPKCT